MRRWIMLALGTAAQTAACMFVYGIPYLADRLRTADRLSLAQVGLVAAAPTLGLVLALVAWGAAADRWGERAVIATGLGGAAALLAAAAPVRTPGLLGVLLAAAGMAAASVFAAGGRLVMGWFTAAQRGLAMGIRQTSTPLGMGLAALAVPPTAAGHGLPAAITLMAAVCGATAVLVALFAANPARQAAAAEVRTENPYRRSGALVRIHTAGALLVVPQFTVGAFALVLLMDLRHIGAVPAGRLVAVGQVLGAGLRIAAGIRSDRVGSRLRPMRQLALLTSAVVAAAAAGTAFPSAFTDAAVVAAVGITAATNGLSFTATAEQAGPGWSGRALGIHNTGQNLAASLTPPLLGAVITGLGYWPALTAAALLAALAAAVVPVRAEPARGTLMSPSPAHNRPRKLSP